MTTPYRGHPRAATAGDGPRLLSLWGMLFDEHDPAAHEPRTPRIAPPRNRWRSHAREWFDRFVDDASSARFTVIEVDREIVATAIGTLDIGVPNPHCPTGRAARLANVITLPEYRGHGHGTTLVLDVVDWAKAINADRVDLSATPAGQRIYEGSVSR